MLGVTGSSNAASCFRRILVALCVLAAANMFADVPTDIYLLIGQSNMAGRGKLDGQKPLPSDRVLKFTKDRKWVECVEPIHFDKPTAGIGPGLAFARSMAESDTNAVIGLVPCAVGGTLLSRWQPGRDLYSNAVERTKAALSQGGRLCGILWHQGENDSWNMELSSTYGVRLTNMVVQLRRELGAGNVPFVAGEVGSHYAAIIEKAGRVSYVSMLNDSIKSAVRTVPAAKCVSSEGLLPCADKIHFDVESSYKLGRRYAAAIQELMQ